MTPKMLTAHFSLYELTRSTTALRLGIDNTPDAEQILNLQALAREVLEPVRTLAGKPMRVTSGFRCQQLNNAVHGAHSSQHTQGNAADITLGSANENHRLYRLIVGSSIPYDQLIGECGFRWLHISHNPNGANRNLHFTLN